MFQAEPILWLQSFESPAIAWLLGTVSLLGYTPVYIALIIILAFGVRLRPGLAVLVALLLAGITTGSLKQGVAFPRPSDIDARVVAPMAGTTGPVFEHGSGTGFWDPPDPAAVAAFRRQPGGSRGFPSGHVSGAAAFFLALALFYRSRRVLFFAAGWIPLMAISRMYLGRHFLADVLAGLAIGVAACGIAVLLLRRLPSETPPDGSATGLLPIALVALALLIPTPFVAVLDGENVGRLCGLVAAYALILGRGMPADGGTIGQRTKRVLTAASLFLVTSRVVDVLWENTAWEDTQLGDLGAGFLATGLTLAGTVETCRRLRWYAAP